MGIGDTIRGAINDATGASAISKALTPAAAPKAQTGDFVRPKYDGHTTSGMDSAMQAQANKLHPVTAAKPVMGADWDK